MTKSSTKKSSCSKVSKSLLCSQKTQKGEGCLNTTTKGSKYCNLHSKSSSKFCGHETTKGGSCKAPKDKCVYHSAYVPVKQKKKENILCDAETLTGQGCKKIRSNGSNYCAVHKLDSSDLCGYITSHNTPCKNRIGKCPYHISTQSIKKKDQQKASESEDEDDLEVEEDEEEQDDTKCSDGEDSDD